MMSGDIVKHVGNFNLVVCYIIGMAVEIIAMLATATVASSYPSAGSVVTYARKILRNDTLGFLTAVALWLGMIAIDGAELMALGRYLFYFMPQLHYYWWGVLVTILFITINILGVVMTSRTQSFLGIMMWSGLMAVPLAILSSGKTDVSYWQCLQETIGFNDWMTAIFFGVYCYVGFVTILPAAEETINPQRRIPLAMIIGTLVTGFFYISGGLAITALRPGAVFMNCVAIATALTTANACVYGGARMLYGMARERQLPKAFRKISEGHKVPTLPIVVTGGFIMITVLSGGIRIVSVIANFVFFPLWAVIAIASYVNLTRAFKSRNLKERVPFYVPGGRLWAVLTLVLSVVLTIITFLATEDVIIGGLITIGFFVVMWGYYVWWKKYNLKKGIDIVKEAEKYEIKFEHWED